MKYILCASSLVLSSLLAFGMASAEKPQSSGSATQPGKTPVIVELFTSEGCSSCPPADALLKKLEEDQPIGKAEVIALEEHVDYWNSGGWTDPFSSAEITYRQQQYAGSLKTPGPYTPQMIIDGHTELIGSRGPSALDEIERAASQPKMEVTLTAASATAEGSRSFSVRVGKLRGASAKDVVEVWMAVTETHLESSVTAGENSGEKLRHAAVLRSLRKIGEAKAAGEFSFSGDVSSKFGANWKRENLRCVVFLQEKKSRRILGAASI